MRSASPPTFARALSTRSTAHVCRLNEILRDGRFDSLLYLSSTRVYQGDAGAADETTPLVVNPRQPGDLYNITKLAGESLALASGRPTKIVRLSNVYDAADQSQGFLPSVIRSALTTGSVTLETAATSTKDYIALDDVISILPRIAIGGRERIYNVCSGTNVSHDQLAKRLADLVTCQFRYAPGAAEVAFPRVSNERLRAEFGLRPASILDDLPALVDGYRAWGELSTC